MISECEVLALRKRLGLTQRQLARLVGASPAAVARWESGTLEVSESYERLLLALRHAPDDRINSSRWPAMIAGGLGIAAFAWLVFGKRR